MKNEKKCDESNQDLAKNDPNAYRANALSRHFLRESMINMSLLLLCTQYQTAVLSKHNRRLVYRNIFSFYENLKVKQTTFSLQGLAAGADFEL